MKILACHNYYQQAGGEDRCFEDECDLLKQRGHEVIRYEKDNDGIRGWNAVVTAGKAIWNQSTYREVRGLIRQYKIDVVHCTNVFPLISPSVYYAAHAQQVPVIQSLQNYRLMCANAYFLREAQVCEKCMCRSVALPAIQHACYRGSRLASAAVVAMQSIHHFVGSWRKYVDRFVVPTEFAREKFIAAGLPADKIAVKPNFVDPAPAVGRGNGGYALFAGRLSPEKGIDVLLTAWNKANIDLPLWIIGDGPLRGQVEQAAEENKHIKYWGFKSPTEVLSYMSDAQFLITPSLWYEGLPRTIVESLAVGTPVVASGIGPLATLIHPLAGGLTFKVGDWQSLAHLCQSLMNDANLRHELRVRARTEYEVRYTADSNYATLMNIYSSAIQSRLTEELRRATGVRPVVRPSAAPPH